jgi:hypothetical protein
MSRFTLLGRMARRTSVAGGAVLTLCICLGSYSPEVRAKENGSRDLLYDKLHDPRESGHFKLTRRKDRTQLEVCEDQCTYFEAPATVPPSTFWDFVFLFQYWASAGSDLEAFRAKTEAHERKLLRKYQKECPNLNDQRELEMCAWRSLAVRYSIRVGVVIYDEGERCQSYWNPSDPIGQLSDAECKPYQ